MGPAFPWCAGALSQVAPRGASTPAPRRGRKIRARPGSGAAGAEERLAEFWTLARSATPAEVFGALEALIQARVGALISTASVFDESRGMARRVHTNVPDAYPLSGLKPVVPNRWTAIVLEGRRTFVANSIEEIAGVFPDHALIASLGCGSVINMPVLLAGRFLGTLNVLNAAGYYTPARVAALEALAPEATAAFAALLLEG
jgi:GAF domain-containing protein